MRKKLKILFFLCLILSIFLIWHTQKTPVDNGIALDKSDAPEPVLPKSNQAVPIQKDNPKAPSQELGEGISLDLSAITSGEIQNEIATLEALLEEKNVIWQLNHSDNLALVASWQPVFARLTALREEKIERQIKEILQQLSDFEKKQLKKTAIKNG